MSDRSNKRKNKLPRFLGRAISASDRKEQLENYYAEKKKQRGGDDTQPSVMEPELQFNIPGPVFDFGFTDVGGTQQSADQILDSIAVGSSPNINDIRDDSESSGDDQPDDDQHDPPFHPALLVDPPPPPPPTMHVPSATGSRSSQGSSSVRPRRGRGTRSVGVESSTW